ncbi:unnamed protein product [Adineta ricciae]|uniref:Gag protein n=1 Tax=Adineta ricciae TaxID=249248 RepID=A0A815T685_ADIRI|nr:unnamed protein product [Adineta ricciae]CAF1610240.1 unnamed protein product [Adineta ricciae]
MLAAELREAQQRAAAQAGKRNQRHAARSRSRSISISNDTTLSQIQSSPLPVIMEAQQYSKIIDTIPVFSGNPHGNIHEWLDLVVLKFDMIGYTAIQKRRFIPQYLTGDALKLHLSHRDQLQGWDDYCVALVAAFPHVETTSRDMNLKLLRDRKQGITESFTDYYTAIFALCYKHDDEMTDLQILDWLKAGMNLQLYERLQGEEFVTPQALLRRAQRVELDTAVLDARKRESNHTVPRNKWLPTVNRSSNWAPPSFSSPSTFPPAYPPLIPPPIPYATNNFPPPAASSTFYSPNFDADVTPRSRRIVGVKTNF